MKDMKEFKPDKTRAERVLTMHGPLTETPLDSHCRLKRVHLFLPNPVLLPTRRTRLFLQDAADTLSGVSLQGERYLVD